MNIKAYLINWLTLSIIIIVIVSTILMRFVLDIRMLSIIRHIYGIVGLLLVGFVVGTILAYNPQTDEGNRLVKVKQWISTKVTQHKHWDWLQGPRAIEFLLLLSGLTIGLCGLILGLVVDLASP